MADYLNFELNIEALDGSRIRVTVNDSPVGSVSADVANPFTVDEISQVIGVMEQSVKASRAERAQAARAFGEKLFNTIFSGQIYAAYLASLERAGDAGLRIKLDLDNAGALTDLPWELLRDPRTDYLVLSRQSPVVRYPRLLTVRPLVEVTLPLRVLVMISSPADQERLDVEGEWRALQEATAALRSRGLVQLERLDDAQLITLQRKLSEGKVYQVFHFIGHSAFDSASQTGMLAFENPRSNATMPVSGESLARELSEQNSIRLVVLNACQAARQNNKDPFAGIASSIVARGVPAVVAMQFAISDEASRTFSEAFYRAISEGNPIETAETDARRAISSTSDDLEWATPVLYLRAPTGILFPRRQSEGTPASTGGLREVLRTPAGLALSALGVIVLVGIIFVLSRIPPIDHRATPTPAGAQDIDIAIVDKKVRVFPPTVKPGERAAISMLLTNNGTTESGPFTWDLYIGNDPRTGGKSVHSETLASLLPGEQRPVAVPYFFGHRGTFSATVWINPDNTIPDRNITNNTATSQAIIVDGPLTIDFSILTDGSPLPVSRDLKGDEYSPWGLTMAASPDSNNCPRPILQLDASGTENHVVSGDNSDACGYQPLTFTLTDPAGGVSVNFVPGAADRYTLELFDANDKKIGQGSQVTVTAAQVSTDVTIQSPPSGAGLNNVRKVRFSSPDKAKIVIQQISFSAPNTTPPTAAP